tara:strand:- start:65 stop:757 length:693 start_codon:yes stop_codon:yes gene_type:complete
MTKILCADTTSDLCSVSLFENNKNIGNESSTIERSHSKLLLVLIDKLVKKSKINIKDIDCFSISMGPGSYTGLRIGVSTFKGLCFSLKKPLISINSLDLLTESALKKINDSEFYLCPMVDARRMEVFTKMLDNNLNEVIKNQAMILDENSFSKFLNDKIYFFGSGAKKYIDLINIQNFKYVEDIRPESKYMGNLSYNKFLKKDFQDVISFEPYYIKDFHLIKKKDKWVRS